MDMGESQETNNFIWLTNYWRNAKRDSSKESMTDSHEIMNSVFEWLNIIEMKKFLDDGMLLRMKITLTIWHNKNTSIARTNGGFIQISKVPRVCPLRQRSDFRQALSALQRLQQAGEEPHVPIYSFQHKQWQLAQSSSSTWWNWQGTCSLLTIQKVKKEVSQVLNKRGNPLFTELWRKLSKMAFKSSIYFVTDGSFTADGGLL